MKTKIEGNNVNVKPKNEINQTIFFTEVLQRFFHFFVKSNSKGYKEMRQQTNQVIPKRKFQFQNKNLETNKNKEKISRLEQPQC